MVDNFVIEAINRIYKKKDYDYFRDKCKAKLTILNDLIDIAKKGNLNIIVESIGIEPSIRIYIKYPEFEKNGLKIEYQTIIDISKIVPVYYFQHEFAVETSDENSMTSVLDGFDSQPYTFTQYNTYEEISKFLNGNGFTELSYADMNTVIPNIEMPKDVSIFGPQFTVEICLFNDVLNICEIED
ncbi:hypothetical protein [Listeria newyorkensis]|uniref:Uncharacterized protein n=1 Tax=Listeria newyorkensis TaxID=1497681 RepID=A0A841Z0D4_9LIST|nr:hypothetical protein [Listeria newyorkensis]MBC1458287.1 hypothetical protein [Listeria newyorkensis]